MLSRIKEFVKEHLDDIILLIGVILISLLSFAVGYITAKQQEKEPIRVIEYEQENSSTHRFIPGWQSALG